jgi:Mg-chelatase subunit ChlD
MSIRPWAIWRRTLYMSGFLAVIGTITVTLYFSLIHETPTCFDEKKNGYESGIDCGGSCVRICAADLMAPEILWAQSFKIADGQYNTVAYIDNRNQLAGTPNLSYTFELVSNGEVVATRSGVVSLPPKTTYPLFEGRIFVDNGKPITETRLTIDPSPLWLPASVSYGQFSKLNQDLVSADSRPRLNVEIENSGLTEANDVEVVATIFNAAGQPVTASQTFVDSIEARETKEIVFTWQTPIARTVKSCIVPTDVALVIDLSGSMNNDSENPPQPLTDTLVAASQFTKDLSQKDQISLITFATNAILNTPLTNSHVSVSETVSSLVIGPSEESGFTNTEAAIKLAAAELASERHNEDARRVLVLLTDGLPTSSSTDDVINPAIAAAKQLNSTGVEIHAIGLGDGVDKNFISAIASSPENAHFAVSGDVLSAVYKKITSELCESGATRIDVISKPVATFAPLQ